MVGATGGFFHPLIARVGEMRREGRDGRVLRTEAGGIPDRFDFPTVPRSVGLAPAPGAA